MKKIIISLLAVVGINIVFVHAASALQIPASQISPVISSFKTSSQAKSTQQSTSNRPSAFDAGYYFIADGDATALNGQSTSQSSVPFTYDIFTGNSSNLFRTFYICPYVYTDYNDVELLNSSYCNSIYMNGFNSGTYYSSTLTTNGKLIYPGPNNISCLIISPSDGGYADCGSSGAGRINYTGTDFPVYRFWSNAKQHHFYTIEHAEKTQVVNAYDTNTWGYEQIAWTAKKFGGVSCSVGSPVYRFWSDQKQGHFYTISDAEKNYIQANYPSNVWRYEGVAYCAPMYVGYCPDASYSPVYRFWSDQKQGHFYTISSSEKDHIQATYPPNVWRYEGIAFCAQP